MNLSFEDTGPDIVRVKTSLLVILFFHDIPRIDLSDLVWKTLILDVGRLARILLCAIKYLVHMPQPLWIW